MRYHFHTVDVFTDRLFGGNPLAVFPDAKGLKVKQMQSIAREFNLSETVFILPPDKREHTRKLRIFTPAQELPFAGHPTIGAAFALASIGAIDLVEGENEIVLEEGVGPVPVSITVTDGKPVFARLTAASEPEFGPPPPAREKIAECLGLKAREVGSGDAEPMAVSCGVPFLFVPLRNSRAVARAEANQPAWREHLSDYWAQQIYLFSFDTRERGAQIHSRMFGPEVGVVEDPATGSAATALAAYLARLERAQEGTLRWIVEQGIEMGRPSLLEVQCELSGGKVTSVQVGGAAVMVSEGDMRVA
jgi:trans-2,3-dihydro-3-hydroxyanthranilate isomerase